MTVTIVLVCPPGRVVVRNKVVTSVEVKTVWERSRVELELGTLATEEEEL